MKAYHFTTSTLRNGQPIPPIGEWLVHAGEIIPCSAGLHASAEPCDALKYAPGPLLHLVELDGELVSHGDPVNKWVGRRRKILKSIDATDLLRKFTRDEALRVIHLWDAPSVVREYLETEKEELRAAAWNAARDVARDVALDAAWAAARVAEWAAARDAAWAAALDAVWERFNSLLKSSFAA